jgi:hypothetical protein
MSFPDLSAQVIEAASQSTENKDVSAPESSQSTQDQAVSQAVYELEKLGRIKYKGEELTPDALEKAMLRMKDYTTKTQSLAKERESLEGERKFYENLAWDLQKVRDNPQLVNQFISTYPAKFHQYLKEYLTTGSIDNTQAAKQSEKQTTPDIELMSRLDRLEKTFTEQEVAKNEAQIQSYMDKLSKKYPDAISDLVLARAVEIHDQGTALNEQVWEQIYKQVDAQGKEFVKSRYGEMVKQQTSANEKAKGVAAGGGQVGQAPKKFSNIRDVGKFAEEQLTKGR